MASSLHPKARRRYSAPSERTEKNYLATALYRRFYRLPNGVIVRIDGDYHRFGDSTRRFIPIGQRYDKFERTESVVIPGDTWHEWKPTTQCAVRRVANSAAVSYFQVIY